MTATVTAAARPTLALSLLSLSPRNARQSVTDVTTLAASIRSCGVLQNLVVIPNSEKPGHFEVIAGGRRLAALNLLLSEGKIDSDFAVPVDVRDAGDAAEITLAENIERQAMLAYDEFKQFVALTHEGKTIDAIADAFGVTPLVVERRLKLMAAAPELLVEFSKAEISTDQMIALCATDNHARQLAAWNGAKDRDWLQTPARLRAAVLENASIEASKDWRVKVVGGVENYVAAGGAVRQDLFSKDGEGVFIEDEGLLDRLVAELLDEHKASVAAEGWGWVEVWPNGGDLYRFGTAKRAVKPYTDAQILRLAELVDADKALQDEYDALEAADDLTAEQQARLDELSQDTSIEDERDAIEESRFDYTPEVKAVSGAVVMIESGAVRIYRGKVKAEDRKAVAAATGDENAVQGGRETAVAGRKDGKTLSDALRRSLLGHRNHAAQVVTASNVHAARVLLACQHVRDMQDRFSYQNHTPTDMRISGNSGTRTNYPMVDEAGQANQIAFRESCEKLVKHLPKAEGALWDALVTLTVEELDAIIARSVALSVSLSHESNVLTTKFLATINLDMAEHFTPTVDNYLGRVSKELMLDALTEAKKIEGAEDRAALLTMKKSALATEAEKRLAGTGWVPALIRAPKPKAVKPAKQPAAKATKKAAAKKPAKKAKG